NISVYDNALEFLDNDLKSQLREMLVPLLDGKVTVAERARLAHRLVRANVENREQAVVALGTSDEPWLRYSGAEAIGTVGMYALGIRTPEHNHKPTLFEFTLVRRLALLAPFGRAVVKNLPLHALHVLLPAPNTQA